MSIRDGPGGSSARLSPCNASGGRAYYRVNTFQLSDRIYPPHRSAGLIAGRCSRASLLREDTDLARASPDDPHQHADGSARRACSVALASKGHRFAAGTVFEPPLPRDDTTQYRGCGVHDLTVRVSHGLPMPLQYKVLWGGSPFRPVPPRLRDAGASAGDHARPLAAACHDARPWRRDRPARTLRIWYRRSPAATNAATARCRVPSMHTPSRAARCGICRSAFGAPTGTPVASTVGVMAPATRGGSVTSRDVLLGQQGVDVQVTASNVTFVGTVFSVRH